jgi:predicted ATPase
VRLFVERARAARASLGLSAANAPAVAEICRWLDGIPLALELAAARVRGLTVEQIADRLSDRFRLLTGGSRTAIPRQQTLRALVDWSHELLSEPERALLGRLAVFSGGCELEAAEAVGAASAAEEHGVLDLLLQLVDKSLVVADEQAGAERYRLLETIRQYALEKLLASGEAAATRSRHRDFNLALAERAARELTGRDQAAWYRRLDAEHDNLRGALEWSRAEADGEKELRLAAALGRFWRVQGHKGEGRTRLSEALAHAGTAPSAARGGAQLGRTPGVPAPRRRAAPLAEEGVAVARAVGDQRLLAIALRHLAWVVEEHGDEPHRAALVEEALAIARAAGDEPEVASS